MDDVRDLERRRPQTTSGTQEHSPGQTEWRLNPRPEILRLLMFNPCFAPAVLVLVALDWLNPWPRPRLPIDADRVVTVDARVVSTVQQRDGFSYAELRPMRVEQAGREVDYPGNVALYVQQPGSLQVPVQYGDTIRIVSYLREANHHAIPGVPDFRQLLWQRGILHVIRLKSPRQVERLPGAEKGLRGWLYAYRKAFEGALRSSLEPGSRKLIASAFLGERALLEDADRSVIRRLGVLHLFVVSGFHVSLVVLLAGALLRWTGQAGMFGALAIGWAYVGLTGAPIATVRAGLMTTVCLGLKSWGLSPRLLNSLGVVTLGLASAWPAAIDSAGFHFCFLSLAVIGMLVQPLNDRFEAGRRGLQSTWSAEVSVESSAAARWQRRVRFAWEQWCQFLPRFVGRCGAVTLAGPAAYLPALATGSLLIQLGTLPLALFYSNLLVPTQVLHNLALVPCFSLLVLLALAWLLVFWLPHGGEWLGWLTGSWAGFVWELMHRLEALSLGVFLPHPEYAVGAAYLLLLGLVWNLSPERWRSLVLVLPLAMLAAVTRDSIPPAGQFSLTFLDVGQGDSIHLRYPDGTSALVDCGGLRLARGGSDFVGRALVGRYLWSQRQRRLSYVLLSHPHADHVQGLEFLGPSFVPARVYYFSLPSAEPGSTGRAWQQLLRGRSFRLGGVHHEILHPARGEVWSINNASLVMRLRFGHFTALLTGDIEAEAEARLAKQESLEPVTVLKVAHHGARTSSSESFLRRVQPQLGVISAGRRNFFGHPAPSTLERLQRLGVPVLSTARQGSVRVLSDGFHWQVMTYDPEEQRFVLRTEEISRSLLDGRIQPGG